MSGSFANAIVGRRPDSFRWLAAAVALGIAGFIVWPIVSTSWQVVAGGLPNQARSSVWDAAFSAESLTALRNTVVVVVIAGSMALLVGGLFAWLNERTNARIGALAEVLPLITLFVPALAGSIGWVLLADPDVGILNSGMRSLGGAFGLDLASGPINLYTWYGLILAYTGYLIPFSYLSIVTAFQSIDASLEEASSVSGAGAFRTFRSVVLPSMRPALGAALLATTTLGIAMFSIPVIIGTRAGIEILPVQIVYDITREFPVDHTSAFGRTLLLLGIVVLAWMIQRRLLGSRGQAFATIGGKHSRANAVDLGRWRRPAQCAMWLYILLAAVLPFLALVAVSLQPFWTPTVNFGEMSLQNYAQLLQGTETRRGLTNSVVLGLVGATIVVILAFVLAHVTEIWRTPGWRFIDGAVKLPIALTHIFVAIALILTFGGPPFGWSGTPLILLVAYVVMYFAQGTFYVNSGVQQVNRSLIEASSVSGASTGATARRVLLPLTAPSLVAGWGLVFVLMMGDVTASAMLASSRTPVVGFVMLDSWTSGTYPELAGIGVLMTLASTCVVLTAVMVARRRRIDR